MPACFGFYTGLLNQSLLMSASCKSWSTYLVSEYKSNEYLSDRFFFLRNREFVSLLVENVSEFTKELATHSLVHIYTAGQSTE